MVSMRDGVRLRTDIFYPEGGGTYPTLVHRYPYSPHDGTMSMFARLIAGQGYAVVVQSTRGRYGSEGVFNPLQSDVEDGYDTVEWAAAESWSNGRVGMYGTSFAGITQWLAAIAGPPHLVCIAPTVAPWDVAHGGFYHSPGILAVGLATIWNAQMTVYEAESRGATPPIPVFAEGERMMEAGGLGDSEMRAKLFAMQPEAARALIDHRPLRDIPEFREFAAWFREWCGHSDARDSYWQRISASAHAANIALPVLHIAGWHDYFTKGNLDAFSTLTHFADAGVQRQQRLVVGPWNHSTMQLRPDPGANAGTFFDFSPEGPTMRFFSHYLKGELPDYEQEPPVHLYVMGENTWREEKEWPLARTVWTPYYLRAEGRLTPDAPRVEDPDYFTYDPAHPAPGPIAQGAVYGDAVDLDALPEREDVLVYETEPFDRPVEITGPVTVELWAASDAPSTDFTASLVEVFEDGTTVLLCQGIVRTSHDGIPSVPGAAYRYEIDLVATSVLLGAGHRLRLDLSSSIYPTFELNPNTGKRITESAETAVAAQTVFHDSVHPSRLILPIIPR
ncbi:CocE/NonD family hydrolase [Arthrobacter sp. efr-133-TYG-118]|uniref:CocE/NonD family hydrolase n=1 Tax=Arthrobacter sp. efr-133-TYG-118 TaxID=3040279 RepID=UPI0033057FBD